jgi:alpha-L-fucosidase
LDWRFPGYFEPKSHPESAAELVQMVYGEVEHLMSKYGQIDLLWYDGSWIDHGRKDVKSADFWKSHELNQMVYDHQPSILVNNRSGLKLDLDTPEQKVEASEIGRAWEACMTIGDSAGWGWLRDNPNRKTQATLLQNLVIAAAGEGNFLINIGPQANGEIDAEDAELLRGMGQWLSQQGEGIYSSQRCDLYDQGQPGAPLGKWTRKGNDAYLHLFRWPGPRVTVPRIAGKVKSAMLLSDDQAVTFEHDADGRLHLSGMPEKPPHPAINTVRIAFEQPPAMLDEPDHAAWIG